ncbi:hypothetical protein C3F09_10750 [candidate division GN15 bacterium]|uniref:Uncharacterized protein n=1 Tax=candidate division GN15 bacterium TaxID=2072418 RepID=A0A855WXB1_9BACT|nr:MAG: hypothetical protein C3F09_10750 [candidate division GN15 bacterium]
MRTLGILALATMWGLALTAQAADTATPSSGGQIKWQVISRGGSHATSAGHILDATAGQAAVGDVASETYRIKQGFLAKLVSYLTGGGYLLPNCP